MRARCPALLLLALLLGCARQGFPVGAGQGSDADGPSLAFRDSGAGDGTQASASDGGADAPALPRDGAPARDSAAPADLPSAGTPVATRAHTCGNPLVVDLANLVHPVEVLIDTTGAAVVTDSSCCSGLPQVILRLDNAPGGSISRVCRSGSGTLRTIIHASDGAACPPPASAGCGQSPCSMGGSAGTSAPSGTVHLRACHDGAGPALLVLER